MIANYHTHTPRCHHALGAEEDYVNYAIHGGLKILGFSDHSPYRFPDNYYSRIRMAPEELEDYCTTILGLKERYVNQIELHIGLEAEYYPALFSDLLAMLRDTPVEYLLLGQHYLGNEIGEHYSGWETDQRPLLVRYCDQVIEGMQTGMFTYLAHPDLLNLQVDDDFYRVQMRRLCREAKACDMPLELNLQGMRAGKHYPSERFWRLAAEENCSVVMGIDAHRPDAVCDPEMEDRAMEMVKRLGLNLLETVELRSIR